MNSAKRTRPLLLFYILVIYVFIQFGWWTYLLIRLNNNVALVSQKVLVLKLQEATINKTELLKEEELLKNKLHKQWLMIFGEGSVFLILLVLGILRTKNSFQKEIELSTQQRNFILSVTHELKSPLASIRLQLETIQKRSLQKTQQEEMLIDAIEDTDRLNVLVENILVAARIDNHSYSLSKENANLSEVVKGLTEKASAGFARNHQIKCKITENIYSSFDKIGFHSIFINLLENAVKYSKLGTEIKISLSTIHKAIVISIADQGLGIAKEEKQQVFTRFYRVGNEETRSTKGTGLGLYIVQSLCVAHGWVVSVTDAPGGGSIFEITIPTT